MQEARQNSIMEPRVVFIAFGLTFFAGLSTGIGSTLAFFSKKTKTRFLSFSPGFITVAG